MPLLYPTSCKCSTESFVNSASPFPLLFFLEEKKQKKVICRIGFLRFSLQFAQSCCTKRMAHIRAGRFFCFKLDVQEKPFCSKCTPQPLCLLFLFFKKRNRSPSFLFRRKEAKENHLPDWFLRFSLHFAQSCCTKRTAHIRAGRFFVASWMCGKPPSVRKAPLSRYVFCFFSSRKEIVPLLFFLEEKKQKKIICGTYIFRCS